MAQQLGVLSGGKTRTGLTGTFLMSDIPVELLQYMWRETPLPISISGSNQITFTLNVSNSAPAYFLAGDDVWKVDSSVAYTWVTGASNTILNSSGVQTASQSAATGVWYFYITANPTGSAAFALYPSKTAPVWNPAVSSWGLQGGYYGHPGTGVTPPTGTTQGQVYIYVGFQVCSSASGAGTYKAMTKVGNTYNLIPDTTLFHTNTPTSTIAASVNVSLFLPVHGVTVGGIASTSNSASDAVFIAQDAVFTGQLLFTVSASATGTFGFSGFPVPTQTANPAIFVGYTGHSASADVQFTQIVDVT